MQSASPATVAVPPGHAAARRVTSSRDVANGQHNMQTPTPHDYAQASNKCWHAKQAHGGIYQSARYSSGNTSTSATAS